MEKKQKSVLVNVLLTLFFIYTIIPPLTTGPEMLDPSTYVKVDASFSVPARGTTSYLYRINMTNWSDLEMRSDSTFKLELHSYRIQISKVFDDTVWEATNASVEAIGLYYYMWFGYRGGIAEQRVVEIPPTSEGALVEEDVVFTLESPFHRWSVTGGVRREYYVLTALYQNFVFTNGSTYLARKFSAIVDGSKFQLPEEREYTVEELVAPSMAPSLVVEWTNSWRVKTVLMPFALVSMVASLVLSRRWKRSYSGDSSDSG